MIEDEHQASVTGQRLEEFRADLERLRSTTPRPGVHPVLHQAQIDAVASQIDTFERELREYREARGLRN